MTVRRGSITTRGGGGSGECRRWGGTSRLATASRDDFVRALDIESELLSMVIADAKGFELVVSESG